MMQKPVYMLVNDIFFATKMVKSAQALQLESRAFDSAERLFQAAKAKPPALVILDCQGLENEAFKVLSDFKQDETLACVPRIGYLSHAAQDLKKEMQAAGAMHVYSKSEFSRDLDTLLARLTHGLPFGI